MAARRPRTVDRRVHGVLGHLPVGGELAPGDGDHPGGRGPHRVAAGEVGRPLARGAPACGRGEQGRSPAHDPVMSARLMGLVVTALAASRM